MADQFDYVIVGAGTAGMRFGKPADRLRHLFGLSFGSWTA